MKSISEKLLGEELELQDILAEFPDGSEEIDPPLDSMTKVSDIRGRIFFIDKEAEVHSMESSVE